MKLKQRSRLLLLAILVVAAMFATACGGSDDSSDEASDADAGAAETEDGESTDAEPTQTDEAESEPESEPEPTETPEPEPEPTATPEPEPEPELGEFEVIEPGPYQVGVQTITVTDEERDRTLTVDVWFPLADGATGDPQQYTLLAGVYYESPFAIASDSADISADGPFPLVIYSHGSGGIRYVHSSYTEAIASHGYVVMAPDHVGNTATERLTDTSDPIDVIAVNRPQDVSAVIDAALDPDHPEAGVFTASIDGDNIGVTGHSFGGYTTYAMASGATIGATEIEPDERVDALVPLSPATNELLLSDERLASIDIPTMVIVGTDDKTTPVDPNVTRPWELIPASPHYRVELIDGEHQTFTDLCDYRDFMSQLEDVPPIVTATITEMGRDGCSEGDIPIERAVELTNTLAIDFFDAALKGDVYFDPTAVVIPDDVTIEAK